MLQNGFGAFSNIFVFVMHASVGFLLHEEVVSTQTDAHK